MKLSAWPVRETRDFCCAQHSTRETLSRSRNLSSHDADKIGKKKTSYEMAAIINSATPVHLSRLSLISAILWSITKKKGKKSLLRVRTRLCRGNYSISGAGFVDAMLVLASRSGCNRAPAIKAWNVCSLMHAEASHRGHAHMPLCTYSLYIIRSRDVWEIIPGRANAKIKRGKLLPGPLTGGSLAWPRTQPALRAKVARVIFAINANHHRRRLKLRKIGNWRVRARRVINVALFSSCV